MKLLKLIRWKPAPTYLDYPMSRISMVQRLSKGYGTKAGFDGLFELEYMGNSSYEGSPNGSLRRIRGLGDIAISPYLLSYGGFTREVFLVGPASRLDEAGVRLLEWSQSTPPFRAEELTYFEECFRGSPRDHVRTIAWWSYDIDIAWTLDRTTAETLVTSFAPIAP